MPPHRSQLIDSRFVCGLACGVIVGATAALAAFYRSARRKGVPQRFTGGGGLTATGRRRICFEMRFNPDRLDEYVKRHETVWPEMQEALVRCGWHNYSLFLRPDGFAIGYFEAEGGATFEQCCQAMSRESVNTRWQEDMAAFTALGDKPDEAAKTLEHYFYLGTDRATTE